MNEEVKNTTEEVQNNNTGNSNNNGNGVMEEKKKAPLLLIIVCIIAGIIGFIVGYGVVDYFFQKAETKNIYYKTIDEFGDALIEVLNDTSKEVKDVLGSSTTVTFNMKSNDKDMKSLANILNKLKISADVETDVKNKKAYANLDLNYNNGELAKGEMLLNNTAIYANIGELYNKPIKLYEDSTLNQLWQTTDNKNYEVVVNKLTNILKISLKEEWFSKTEEEIDVLGSKVKVYNHTLKLDGDRLYEFANSVLDEMIKDKELLTALSNIMDRSEDSIKSTLSDAKTNIQKNNNSLESVIYINKKNDDLEKANIKMTSDGETVELNLTKSSKDTFDIKVGDNKLGTLTATDDNTAIDIDYNGVVFTISSKKQGNSQDINFKLVYSGDTIELAISDNDGNGTLKVRLVSTSDDIDLTVNVSYSEKDINKITEFSTNNYVEVDKLTDTDINNILTKLQENNAYIQLIQDLANSNLTI